EAVEAMRAELFGRAHLVTPNVPEAEVLSGVRIAGVDDMYEAGRRILALGPRLVLVKGGHLDGGESGDVAGGAGGSVESFESFEIRGPRHAGPHSHGTGCTLSAAIAANLALGRDDRTAIDAARVYLDGAIRHAPGLGHGHGPLNHFWRGILA